MVAEVTGGEALDERSQFLGEADHTGAAREDRSSPTPVALDQLRHQSSSFLPFCLSHSSEWTALCFRVRLFPFANRRLCHLQWPLDARRRTGAVRTTLVAAIRDASGFAAAIEVAHPQIAEVLPHDSWAVVSEGQFHASSETLTRDMM